MMKKLTLSTEKGGVGKTALSVNLARFFAERGKRTLVVDLDVQCNASDSLSDCRTLFNSYELFTMPLGADLIEHDYEATHDPLYVCKGSVKLADLTDANLQQFVTQAEENFKTFENVFDVVILDTPPTLGASLVASLLLSEKVLIPIEVELSSLSGANNVATTIGNLKRVNPKLELLGIVVNKMQNKPRQQRNLEVIRQHPVLGKLLLPTMIYNRDAIAQALSENCKLRDIKKTAARKALSELNALGRLVMSKMFN